MHRRHEFEGVHGLGINQCSSVWIADNLEPHAANVTKVANQFLYNDLASHREKVTLLILLRSSSLISETNIQAAKAPKVL